MKSKFMPVWFMAVSLAPGTVLKYLLNDGWKEGKKANSTLLFEGSNVK